VISNEYPVVETPFDYRNLCWFCGEPKLNYFEFPHHLTFACPHPSLAVPACKECRDIARKLKEDSIWQTFHKVKAELIKTYQKHLAIGINWTQQELAESQFEGGNFESFQRSAWFMYEIAKARVNFKPWKLEIAGIYASDYEIDLGFTFDGISYPTIEHAVNHYAKTFKLNREFLRQLVSVLGEQEFSYAVRLCRIMIDATPNERAAVIREVSAKRR